MRGDAFDGFLPAVVRHRPLQRNTANELVAVVDVEDDDAGAAVFQVVTATDAWQRRVQETLPLLRRCIAHHHRRCDQHTDQYRDPPSRHERLLSLVSRRYPTRCDGRENGFEDWDGSGDVTRALRSLDTCASRGGRPCARMVSDTHRRSCALRTR